MHLVEMAKYIVKLRYHLVSNSYHYSSLAPITVVKLRQDQPRTQGA